MENTLRDAHEKSALADMEAESARLMEIKDGTRAELEIYYAKLAEETKKETDEDKRFHELLRERTASLKRTAANLGKAYLEVFEMTDELETRIRDVENSRKKRIILSPPSNTTIDFKEIEGNNFARGTNFYKLFLICFIGSFAGVIIELLWCLIRNGYIESRSGLVWGPFNLLYGLGAAALTVALYKFRNRSILFSFFGGMVVGSAAEYLCSFFQELVFGSRSWDYSYMPFNLNGRICLLYSIFWGVLGAFWIKNMYPRIADLILKIPNKAGKIITIVLAVFMLFNAVVSGAAVMRWSQRQSNTASPSRLGCFIDRHFPDERMEKIYANMKFSG